ncbi:hypothetical protein LSM04_001593 [Trypanosoma melophagium]|uniref:uncharacterized protein n=1 Tax=Trypanosoma melophagium TaxID=715481 RepID=UPI00351A4A44|nr:hypothetical protein LSM04_001593 [Trypanosoma melophagium]
MPFLPPWHQKPLRPREASLACNISHYLARKLNDMHMHNTRERVLDEFSLSSAVTIPPAVSNVKSFLSKESTALSHKEDADPLASFYELRSAYYRLRQRE